MTVRRIVPDLPAADLERAREFYTGILGLNVAMDLGWVLTFTSPGNPTAQVTLLTRDQSAPVNPNVSIEVDDVDVAYAEAVQRGFEIVHPLTDEPWGVRRFFVRDPGGSVINILSHS